MGHKIPTNKAISDNKRHVTYQRMVRCVFFYLLLLVTFSALNLLGVALKNYSFSISCHANLWPFGWTFCHNAETLFPINFISHIYGDNKTLKFCRVFFLLFLPIFSARNENRQVSNKASVSCPSKGKSR